MIRATRGHVNDLTAVGGDIVMIFLLDQAVEDINVDPYSSFRNSPPITDDLLPVAVVEHAQIYRLTPNFAFLKFHNEGQSLTHQDDSPILLAHPHHLLQVWPYQLLPKFHLMVPTAAILRFQSMRSIYRRVVLIQYFPIVELQVVLMIDML